MCRSSGKDGGGVTAEDFRFMSALRDEQANYQKFVIQIAIFTFSTLTLAVGLREGLMARFDPNTRGLSLIFVIGLSSFLLCSVILQQSCARKIFWIAAYIRRFKKDHQLKESRWEREWYMARNKDRHFWLWSTTSAIGFVHLIATVLIVFLVSVLLWSDEQPNNVTAAAMATFYIINTVNICFSLNLVILSGSKIYDEKWSYVLDKEGHQNVG